MTEFLEQISVNYGKINRGENRISGVAVLHPTSANCSFANGEGREYTPKAMESLVGLLGGRKAFIDHAGSKELESKRGVRSVRDLLGYFESPRLEGGIARADLVYLKNHKTWIEPLVEQMSGSIGLSIHAYGPSAYDKNVRKEIVEDISVLKSVDLVTEPGSTMNLFESRGGDYWIDRALKELDAPADEKEIAADFERAFGIFPKRNKQNREDRDLIAAVRRGEYL